MSQQANILELNGKKYDAQTGQLIADKPAKQTSPLAATDPSDSKTKLAVPKSHEARAIPLNLQRKQQHAKTLMRHTVHKPVIKPHQKKHLPLALAGVHTLNDVRRAQRAQRAPMSTLVNKFGKPVTSAQSRTLPIHNPSQPRSHAVSQPLALKSTVNPFERAVQQAHSHEQAAPKKPRVHHRVAKRLHVSPKLVSIGAASAAIIVLGGFYAYQNMPNLGVRFAAMRSHVSGTLPGYHPAGFALKGPVSYSTGVMTLQYRSTTDDRSFSIIQRNSAWDSNALRENYVATHQKAVQTVQDNGKTIFIDGSSNATWVDGGVWFQISGNASLSNDQLLKVARSL